MFRISQIDRHIKKTQWMRNLIFSLLLGLFSLALDSHPAHALPFISTDIVIDVGHGGIDGGTSHDRWLEKNLNLEIAKLLQTSLKAYNIHSVLNRSTDMALSDDNHWLHSRSRHLRDLAQRHLVMESLRPKLIVSLHCNWAAHPSRHGPVVLYQANPQSFLLANLLQYSLNDLYHTVHPPIYSKNLYILNRASPPAVIVEMGFISSPVDQKMLTVQENQLQIVEAIRSALWEYLLMFQVQ